MPKFRNNIDGSRSRLENINNVLYEITIPLQIWETISHDKICRNMSYWIKRTSLGKCPMFKYGTINVLDSIPETGEHYCTECNVYYKTRSGIFKHNKKYHSSDTQSVDTSNQQIPLENIRIMNTNCNNTTNNVTNNNITNIQINVTPRSFMKENPLWLTQEVFLDAICDLTTAIPKLIKAKHFNDKFPENNNIRLSDKRDLKKRLKLFKNKRWAIENREDVVHILMYKMYDILDEFFRYFTNENETPTDDDDLTEEEIHHRRLLEEIQMSQRAKRIITRVIGKWRVIEKEISDRDEELMEKINDRFDTLLLDNELKISQLENQIIP